MAIRTIHNLFKRFFFYVNALCLLDLEHSVSERSWNESSGHMFVGTKGDMFLYPLSVQIVLFVIYINGQVSEVK